jgi:hypothetical protein
MQAVPRPNVDDVKSFKHVARRYLLITVRFNELGRRDTGTALRSPGLALHEIWEDVHEVAVHRLGPRDPTLQLVAVQTRALRHYADDRWKRRAR